MGFKLQTLQIQWKSCKVYAPAGRLYSTFWLNLRKNFSFGVLHPYRCTDGVKFGVEDLHTKFNPIGATCRPCGAKNLKIGLWVN